MIDYGWWFVFERKDGKPLAPWQFAGWMIVSPFINLLFVIGMLLAGIVYGIGSIVLSPFFYFEKTYAEYRKSYDTKQEKAKQQTWKALKK